MCEVARALEIADLEPSAGRWRLEVEVGGGWWGGGVAGWEVVKGKCVRGGLGFWGRRERETGEYGLKV